MAKNTFRKGNNLAEYVIIFVAVGFAVGYAIWNINPDTFKNYFKTTFSNTSGQQQQDSFTIGPISE